jgi:hypothetical protein
MFKIAILSVVGACAVTIGLLSSGASYAGAPAATGVAFPFTEEPCFAWASGGAVINDCSSDKHWIVSDNIPASGNHTIWVTGKGPLRCQACAASHDGLVTACTAMVTQALDRHIQFSLGTLNVPPFGSLYVECILSPGAIYDSAAF